ncbi:MAG TPA: DUF3052 domain-containing protein [Phycicoccus sp.]|nr:DUF3052 domain-containing protein [Phycicoccus sp.]
MSTPTPATASALRPERLTKLGFRPDLVVQEFGVDDDTDEGFRSAVAGHIGGPLEDENYTGEADAVLLWWRGDDGDLTDALVDLVGVLGDGGFVVLLTPRAGHGAVVEASDIEEAAETAGLHASGDFTAAPGWRGIQLRAAKSRR